MNRKNVFLFSGAIALLSAGIFAIISLSSATAELERLKKQHDEMYVAKDEFISLKARVDEMERKKKLTKVNGVISAVEDVFSNLGLKARIKSVKPLGSRSVLNDIEEDAEVLVEKVSMNEMINLFYKIENAPMLLVLKKADIRTSFEKPDLMNLAITVSLVYEK